MDTFDQSKLSEQDKQILNYFKERRDVFERHIKDQSLAVFTCPSCGFPTLGERGVYEICRICDWEDDNQDNRSANEVWGGPNGGLSLTESRLAVGRRINENLASGKKLVVDPRKVLQIIDEQDASISDFAQHNIKGDTRFDDPVYKEYVIMRKNILNKLFES